MGSFCSVMRRGVRAGTRRAPGSPDGCASFPDERLGDAEHGGASVLGKLPEQPEAFEEVGRIGDDPGGRLAVVAIGEEPDDGLEGYRVGVGREVPSVVMALGNPPEACHAAGHASGVGPVVVWQGRPLASAFDDPLEALLWVPQGGERGEDGEPSLPGRCFG